MTNKYLLDTHVFLWVSYGPGNKKLTYRVREAVENPESEIYVSSISLFEIAAKYRKGQLQEFAYIAENCIEVLCELGAKELPLTWEQADFSGKIRWEHKDPFDRMLAAQAMTEGLVFITSDPAFSGLKDLSTLW